MQAQLGAESAAFEQALETNAPVSIRLNPKKSMALEETENLTIPWCAQGRYLPARPAFVEDPAFHAGQYYVQEASSMFLDWAVRQLPAPHRVLDLCGAPGGKSTLLAAAIPSESILVANEVIGKRAAILAENLTKWGYPNTLVTSADPAVWARSEAQFDWVVVDAPCSGEGLFRKDPQAREEWSPEAVTLCAARQKRILAEALKLVLPGGHMIYSTCTYNASENQENIQWVLEQGGWETIALSVPPEWGVQEVPIANGSGYAFWPHRVKGEGFFLAVLRKVAGEELRSARWKKKAIGPWKPFRLEKLNSWAQYLENTAAYSWWCDQQQEVVGIPVGHEAWLAGWIKSIAVQQWGGHIGRLSPKEFIPSHGLAMSPMLDTNYSALPLDRTQALRYLQREALPMPAVSAKGWKLARYENLALGWLKVVPGRMNNYYPKAFRIRKQLHL